MSKDADHAKTFLQKSYLSERRAFFVLVFYMLPKDAVAQMPELPLAQSGEAAKVYAPIKRPLQPVIQRNGLSLLLPGPYPDHGIITAQANILTPTANWYVVDFDAQTIKHLETTTENLSNGERKISINYSRSRLVSSTELGNIILQANILWNPPLASSEIVPSFPTDAISITTLFDGSDVLQQYGPGGPSGPLNQVIFSLKIEENR